MFQCAARREGMPLLHEQPLLRGGSAELVADADPPTRVDDAMPWDVVLVQRGQRRGLHRRRPPAHAQLAGAPGPGQVRAEGAPGPDLEEAQRGDGRRAEAWSRWAITYPVTPLKHKNLPTMVFQTSFVFLVVEK